jgi:hypothetical protein
VEPKDAISSMLRQQGWASRYTFGCRVVGEEDRCSRHGASRYEPIGLHEARHSFVSMMHDAGFSLE